MVVLHNWTEIVGHCTQAMIESNADALHFGNSCDMVQALEECPDNLIVSGEYRPCGHHETVKCRES